MLCRQGRLPFDLDSAEQIEPKQKISRSKGIHFTPDFTHDCNDGC